MRREKKIELNELGEMAEKYEKDEMGAKSIGVDVGGTFTDIVGYTGDNGDFFHIATLPTTEFASKPEILVELLSGFQPCRIIFGIAAWVRRGKILRAPNLSDFQKLERLARYRMVNDANCFAFYAAHFTGFKNVFAVTLGTGVGSGIVVNGELYEGTGLAGEIGHVYAGGDQRCVCGGVGHLETYFSGWAIKGKFGKELDRNELLNYQGFDVLCRQVASIIMVLDPECVAFGGRISTQLEAEDFRAGIKKYLMPEFKPEFVVIKDALAVAKGAALLAASGGE